jgi:NADPH:quinone reductase-like Zn-dependent oxidoreductase
MRAAVYRRYGPPEVVELAEVEKPSPRAGEVLIRIRATTITSGDHRARSLDLPPGFGPMGRLIFGVLGPRQQILGSELSGDVEAVGKDVRSFRVGDPVVAFSGARMGCHAEYRCIPEDGAVVPKPVRLSYAEAASLPFGGTTALHFLGKLRLARGARVLVNGASGAVGTAFVQLARHLGAEVTGVCSAANAELVKSLGAAHVIDYAREDFARHGNTYDVIVDTVGTAPYSRSKRSLAPHGRFLPVLASLPEMLRGPLVALGSDRKVIAGVSPGSRDDLRQLVALADAGAIAPIIDRSYPMERIVEAHRHVDSGRKRGSVVVTVA